jgi:hypothetical protein
VLNVRLAIGLVGGSTRWDGGLWSGRHGKCCWCESGEVNVCGKMRNEDK